MAEPIDPSSSSTSTPAATSAGASALRQGWHRLAPRSSRRARGDARRLAIDAGADWARGVLVERAAGRLTVLRACEETFAIDAERPDVRALLGAGGLPCVAALGREDALIGRLELPTDDEAELRAMARMALARDYSVDGAETLSDFQRSSANATVTSAVAASATRARVDDLSARIGAPVARMSVRALGMLALVRTSDTMMQGSTLALDVTRGALECTLVREGELVHSRGVAIVADTDERRTAAVLIEFRRLVAALRSAPEGLSLDRIVIAADRALAGALAPQVAAIAGCSATRLDSHARIGFASPDVREQACASCLPLLGLLLEDDAAIEPTGDAVDLLHPTPLIDVAARTRQRVLIVAGVMLVAAFGGWTFGARSWRNLEEQHDDLLAKARNASPSRLRYNRDEFKVMHIEAYRALTPMWLDHLDALRRYAPDPSVVVLDGLTAQLDGTEIEWTEPKKAAPGVERGFAMTATPELRFVLDGEARDRTTADALRDALVKEKGYTVASTGADARGGRRLPYPFAYTIRTADLKPRQVDATKPADPPQGGTP